MNLTELKPRPSKLKLAKHNKEFILNPITLADEVWLDEEFGMVRIAEIFQNLEIAPIARIVYRVIRTEDKQIFKKRKVSFVTEDGDSLTEEMGGLELFLNMITGMEDKLAMINALSDNLGLSRPEPVKKKKVTKKKSPMKTKRKTRR